MRLIEVAKNLAAGLPLSRLARRSLDYHPDLAGYAFDVFTAHAGLLSSELGWMPEGKHVLEIGPGATYGGAFLFALAGARATAIDIRPELVANHDHVLRAVAERARAGHASEVDYRAPVDASQIPLPDVSIDLCYSTAVLEHVRDPEAVVREQARVVMPGGLVSHQIDLGNHLDRARPNSHRYVSRRQWEWMTSRRSAFSNRLTRQNWRDLFTAAGFEILLERETAHAELTAEELQRVHPDFRAASLDDLGCLGVHLVARRNELQATSRRRARLDTSVRGARPRRRG